MPKPQTKKHFILGLFLLPFSVLWTFVLDIITRQLEKRFARLEQTTLLSEENRVELGTHDVEAGGCASCDCFGKGTFVAVADVGGMPKAMPIEAINAGDQVFAVSFLFRRPRFVVRRVRQRSAHPAKLRDVVEIITASGSKLVTTVNHPVVLDCGNRTKPAGRCSPGERVFIVRDAKPRWETIVDVRRRKDISSVYNIELEGEPHNYLVSADGEQFTLVHNK